MLTDAAIIRRLLFGALRVGSLLQLDNPQNLPPLLMIHLTKFLKVVTQALSKVPSFAAKQTKTDAPLGVNAIPHKDSDPSLNHPGSVTQDSKPPSPLRPSTFSSSLNPPTTVKSLAASVNSSTHSQQSSPPHLTERAHTRTSSRTATRLDWYQCLDEGKVEEAPTPPTWCGYGGEARRFVEVDDSTSLRVSPAFGCLLVGSFTAQTLPHQLKVVGLV